MSFAQQTIDQQQQAYIAYVDRQYNAKQSVQDAMAIINSYSTESAKVMATLRLCDCDDKNSSSAAKQIAVPASSAASPSSAGGLDPMSPSSPAQLTDDDISTQQSAASPPPAAAAADSVAAVTATDNTANPVASVSPPPLPPHFTAKLDVRYGSQKLDIFYPTEAALKAARDKKKNVVEAAVTEEEEEENGPLPVFIFIHGGYWRALGKKDSCFMVPALTAAGAIVVVPDYDLAPAVTLDHIVHQMREAFAWVYKNIGGGGDNSTTTNNKIVGDPNNICISGSSAGGHLVGMLLAKGWQSSYDLPLTAVPASALPLSGLMDLQPLMLTHINGWMGLDDAAAVRNSPRFHMPDRFTHGRCVLRICCGEFESREFHRQSREYLAAWTARALCGEWVECPATNHYDLPLGLMDEASVVHKTALQLMGLL